MSCPEVIGKARSAFCLLPSAFCLLPSALCRLTYGMYAEHFAIPPQRGRSGFVRRHHHWAYVVAEYGTNFNVDRCASGSWRPAGCACWTSLCVFEDRSLNDAIRKFPAFDELLEVFNCIWQEKLLSSLLAHTRWYMFNQIKLAIVLKRVGHCRIDHCFFHGCPQTFQVLLIRSSSHLPGSGS